MGRISCLVLQSTYLLLVLFLYDVVNCSPPEDPIKCLTTNTRCTITNGYGAFPDRSICKAANVAYPTTENELISVVAEATKAERKMKVATRYSHSIPKLVCPDGENGLIISTKYLNRTLKIDVKSMTMTVETGVTLKQLINDAAQAGLALPHSSYWWGLTIGGLLGTAAHGSSWWGKGGAVHEYVAGLTIVTPGGPEHGYVQVRTLHERDGELNAAAVSLGVLGVISKVTLKLQPLFKRSITYVEKSDADLGEQVGSFGNKHEFGDILWNPSQHRAVYRIDDRVPSNVPGNGLHISLGYISSPSIQLVQSRISEDLQELFRDVDGKCSSAEAATTAVSNMSYGLTNDGVSFTGYPVIGYQNRMQASGGCVESPEDSLQTLCSWDPRINGLFAFQTGVCVSKSVSKNFIQDVQKLVDLNPKALCGVDAYVGIIIRYVKASNAYLGKQKDCVDFDITYYRSKDPMVPRLYEDILEEIEQMAVFKYGGLPHWGKNRNVAFDGVIRKYKNAEKFLRVKEKYDPLGLFSNEWTNQILGIKGEVRIVKEGCALEGLCICSEDYHCAPSKGYFCKPGQIYKSARVCTFVNSYRSS